MIHSPTSKDDATSPLKLLYRERETAVVLGVCQKTVFNLTKSGQLRAVKIGRSVRYTHDELRRFVAALAAQEKGGDA